MSHTTGVVAGGQQDATGGFPYPDDMARSRSAEDAVLADDKLLDAICSANLGDQLCDLGVPVASVTADDQSRAFNALGDGE